MPSKRGKPNKKKAEVRAQRRLVRSIAYRYSFHDILIGETVWTPKTRTMVEVALQVNFEDEGVWRHLFEDDGTVLVDSQGKGAYQQV